MPTAPILLLTAAALALMAALFLIGKVPLRYNFRNLTVRWRTTLMTALAFTLVVSLMIVMLAFVEGMQRLTESSGVPGNVMILSDGATDETFSNLPPSDLIDIENQPDVVRKDGTPLASRETYLVINQPIKNAGPNQPQRRFLQIRGLEDPAMAGRVHNLTLYPGGAWFSEAGVEDLPAEQKRTSRLPAIQVVLGEGIARELGRQRTAADRARARNSNRLDVGDAFPIGQRTFRVTGILRSAGSTFDSEVWAKQSIVGPFFGKENFTTVVLRTPDAKTAQKLKDFFNGGDENDPFATGYKKADVQAQVETEYFASLSATTQQFLISIIVVTAVLSVGGVFGVMNTMFAAISQRIKDIGVLRLLGYSRRQILVSFFLESLLIALIGGLLGCALGALTDGWQANSVVGRHAGGKFVVLRLVVDASILGYGMLLALLMGGLGGLIPALSAMRLKPLEALR